MPRLHIFNPETDYALASGSPYYTPPASVIKMRKAMALLPLDYANPDDAVLLLDAGPTDTANAEIPVYRPDDNVDWTKYEACPWGWNHQIAHFLNVHCPGLRGIPSSSQLDEIRNLSHRRTTVQFLKEMDMPGITLPKEINDIDEAMVYFEKWRPMFFKAPWSSSGRGVLYTADLTYEQTLQWIKGIIRSQGAVMAEKAYAKSLDFATEWTIDPQGTHFIGISVFEASKRGKYHRNYKGSQAELWNMIPNLRTDLIERQRATINKVIAPCYYGPLGIDMLVTVAGLIHPCIEINLRNTMGSILIDHDDHSLFAKFPYLF